MVERMRVKGGKACTPHPHQARLILPLWWNVRHKVAIATLGQYLSSEWYMLLKAKVILEICSFWGRHDGPMDVPLCTLYPFTRVNGVWGGGNRWVIGGGKRGAECRHHQVKLVFFLPSLEPEFLNFVRTPGIDPTELISCENKFCRRIDSREGGHWGPTNEVNSSFKISTFYRTWPIRFHTWLLLNSSAQIYKHLRNTGNFACLCSLTESIPGLLKRLQIWALTRFSLP